MSAGEKREVFFFKGGGVRLLVSVIPRPFIRSRQRRVMFHNARRQNWESPHGQWGRKSKPVLLGPHKGEHVGGFCGAQGEFPRAPTRVATAPFPQGEPVAT